MKYRLTNQMGFTILELSLASVLVVVLTSVGIYTFNRVNNSEVSKQQTSNDNPTEIKELKVDESEKTEKVTVPAETSTVKPTPPPPTTEKTTEKTESKPSYTSITVNLTDVDINTTRALFGASWSGSYAGKCYLTVKNLTTGAYVSKEVIASGTSCSFEVPKTELSAGSYKYYITFKNNEYTVKGSSDYKTFNL